jgi:hypothetical protein
MWLLVCTAWINNTVLTLCHAVYSRLYDSHRKQRLFRYKTLASWCVNGDSVSVREELNIYALFPRSSAFGR